MRCPLCIQTKKKLYEEPAKNLELNRLIHFLDKLPNLERVNLEGNYSEPLLYPEILSLIAYFKKRSLKIIISTNASFKGEDFWTQLGELLNEDDVIRFAIDGSNQELYSKYRVGGDLSSVLKNHSVLKRNSKCRTVLQNIRFKFNQNDEENIKNIFQVEKFDYLNFTKCYMSSEFSDEGVSPIDEVKNYYKLFNRAISSEEKVNDPYLICDSKLRGEIYINHNGEVYLCGSHDSGGKSHTGITIDSEENDIFKFLNDTFMKRSSSSICKSDCNVLCYSVGRKYPDTLIDKNGTKKEIKYFSKDIDEDHREIEEIFNAVMKR